MLILGFILIVSHLSVKDYYHNNCTIFDNTVQQLDYSCALVRECRDILRDPDDQALDIVLLEAVAKARYGLTVCAQWFYRLYIEENVDKELTHVAKKLCDAASYLCDQKAFKWPR